MLFHHTFNVSPAEHAALRFAELHFGGPGGGPIWEQKGAHRIQVNGQKLRPFAGSPADPRALPVTEAIKPGENHITVESPFVPDKAIAAVLILETKDGKSRAVVSDGSWRARAHEADKPGDAWRGESAQNDPWASATVRGKFEAAVDPKEAAP